MSYVTIVFTQKTCATLPFRLSIIYASVSFRGLSPFLSTLSLKKTSKYSSEHHTVHNFLFILFGGMKNVITFAVY